jgi:hypothetical protein
MHGASAALRDATAIFRAGQAKMFAQNPEQRSGGLNIHLHVTFIYRQRNHESKPPPEKIH